MRVTTFLGVSAASGVTTGNDAFNHLLKMLGDMIVTSDKEKAEESAQFASYKVWCTATTEEKEKDIERATQKIKNLDSEIKAGELDIEEHNDIISTETVNLATRKDDLKAMAAVRQLEREKFQQEQNDLQDSIEACDQAIKILSDPKLDTAKKKSHSASEKEFMQLTAKVQRKNISERRWFFIQSAMDAAKPAQARDIARSKQSGPIIDMLKNLQTDFVDELREVEGAELNQKNNYEKEVSSLKMMNDQSKTRVDKRKTALTVSEDKKGKDEMERTTQSLTRKEDKAFLMETKTECGVRAENFSQRMAGRAAEKQAIQQALDVLNDGRAAKGVQHVLFQQAVFLQIASHKQSSDKLVNFLKERGLKLNSKALVQMAQLAKDDPFANVKKMINKLITRLEEEAASEADNAAWCEKEQGVNDIKLAKYSKAVREGNSNSEALTANIQMTQENVDDLSEKLKELRADLAQRQEQRAENKAENMKVIQETKDAAEAVEKGIEILSTFYENMAFAQVAPAPKMTTGEYKGMGPDGVIGLMENVAAKLRTELVETETTEASQKEDFYKFELQTRKSIASADTNHGVEKERLASYKSEFESNKADLRTASDNKKDATKYKNEVLDPKCVNQGEDFEAVSKKRKAEIQSLQEALQILTEIGQE